jgi:hypothetical protein
MMAVIGKNRWRRSAVWELKLEVGRMTGGEATAAGWRQGQGIAGDGRVTPEVSASRARTVTLDTD